MGPNNVDGDVADPDGDGASGDRPVDVDGDGASGDRPLGLLTGGNVGPQASPDGTNGSAGENAPLGGERFSWPLGQTEHLAGGLCRRRRRGSWRRRIGRPHSRPFGRRKRQPTGIPGGTTGSADGRDAPSTIAMDVGPAADGHGMTEDNVGGANASLPDANVTPAGQSTRLYLLFKGSSAGSGRQIALVGRDGQLNG